MPQNNDQPAMLGEESLTVPGPKLSSFVNDFDSEALKLSPFNFPTMESLQGSPENMLQLPNSATLLPSGYDAQSSNPDKSFITAVASTYPEIPSAHRFGLDSQPAPPQQLQRSQSSLALPQAYSVSNGEYLQGGVQQAHFLPSNFNFVGQPPPFRQPARPGHLSQQPGLPLQPGASPELAISTAEAGPSQYQTGNLLPSSRQHAATYDNILDPSAANHTPTSYSQQEHPTSELTHRESSPYAAPVISLYPDPSETNAWRTSSVPQQYPPPPQHPSVYQDLATQQYTTAQQSPLTQPTPQLQPDSQPNLLIDPQIASSSYLWTQLEGAQLTMLGVLTALLVRTRNRNENRDAEAGGVGGLAGSEGEMERDVDVDEAQVQTVTRNLINVMTLWWLIRRERGRTA